MQLQTHYTQSIYDAFAAEHMKRLYHCEIEKHMTLMPWREWRSTRRDVIHPYKGKFFQGGYPSMTDKYKYNSLKKWFDRNCGVVLDNNAKYMDFKNVLKGSFNAYSDWNENGSP
ncbi:hypothetical protein H5410_014312 [Solanum commersonii]|uniref:Uncharacterized protein n=1 Tax=Solanum commersonii TaxID=4109 RepID=A0A9J5ZQN3_SOLCO|nr:hypothetical protein H5410_014312 [Solanum commersonii]